MPAVSPSQRRLMGAAEHGATFPKAKALRKSMTHDQLHDFASTKGLKKGGTFSAIGRCAGGKI